MGGCALAPAPPADGAATADRVSQCASFFAAFDRAVAAAGAGDAESARLAGHPHLRADRFLASHRDELPDERLRAWTDALLRLDRDAREIEYDNLPPGARRQLLAEIPRTGLPDAAPAALTEGCGATLRERDLATPGTRSRLRAAVVVPDDYQMWKRVAGLYALTRIPFAQGVRAYEDSVRAVYAAPPATLPVLGRLVRYAPRQAATDASGAAELARRVARAGASFEAPAAEDVERLLALYAPVFEVDEAVPEDRIGMVRLDAAGRAVIDTSAARVYGRVAYTRVGGRVLAQAVYTAWFPGRPKTSPFDLLGGRFDAVVWRATLEHDGTVAVFDTMHACGCYHMFFPTPRAAALPRPQTLDEWAFVPQTLPSIAAGQRVRLRIAARSHYLVRVLVDGAAAVDAAEPRSYALDAETALRSLPASDGTRRSLYGPDGLVAGSERGERYLFWPMGIEEPGAMRQWGRHATAFVGRRHFDGADLFPRYFVLE